MPLVPVSFKLEVKNSKPAKLIVCDNDGNSAETVGDIPETAINTPLSAERCQSYLNKTVNGYALYPDVPDFGAIMGTSAAAILDSGKNITYDAESLPEFSDEVYKYYMLKNGFDFIAQNGYDMYIKDDLTVLAGFYDDVFRVLIVEE